MLRLATLPLAFVCSLGAATPARAQTPPRAAAAAPKLVVLISVDQMRADYFEQFGGRWSGGLKTLYTRGAQFRNARLPYLETITCAGHATIGTGAFPHRHGMVLNTWWDERAGRMVECTEDPAFPLVYYGDPPPPRSTARAADRGHSAHHLRVPTLAQTMKAQLGPPARVASFSSKPRSAIGLAGPGADLVVWREPGAVWATSRAYASAPSPLVENALRLFPAAQLIAHPWERLLPPARYKFADDAPAERVPISFWTRSFPHPLAPPTGPPAVAPDRTDPLAAWEESPFPDEVLLALARAALHGLKLGQGPGTDFLAVSFSALDVVGHDFGPRSHEVQDVLYRLDRLLGELLAALDAQVGRGRWVLALSADHGVAVIPEQAAAEGKDAGRVPMTRVQQVVEAALVAELGARPAPYVAKVNYTDVHLHAGVYDRLRAKPGAALRVLQALRGVPGVMAAYATDQLRDPARAPDALARAAAFSHFPGRSGQLILIPKTHWMTTSAGTTHGTLADYDQRVPVLLYGAGIRAGRYDRAVTPADIAPTLAALVGVELREAEGTPLREALSSPRPARPSRAAPAASAP